MSGNDSKATRRFLDLVLVLAAYTALCGASSGSLAQATAATAFAISDGAPSDFFGYSVAISGDVALVGAKLDDDKGMNSGSAYVFRFIGST